MAAYVRALTTALPVTKVPGQVCARLEARAITVNGEDERGQRYSLPKDALTARAAVGEEQKDGSSRVSWEGRAHVMVISIQARISRYLVMTLPRCPASLLYD